jgi:hypothetical protein
MICSVSDATDYFWRVRVPCQKQFAVTDHPNRPN